MHVAPLSNDDSHDVAINVLMHTGLTSARVMKALYHARVKCTF